MFQHSSSRILTALVAASMLSACQGGAAGPPPSPAQAAQSVAQSVQTAARSTASHHEKTPEIAASPASLEFTAAQAAAGTPQTVTISAKDDGRFNVTIAGTGNCPNVSPAKLQAKKGDDDDDKGHDGHDGHDARGGVITVTPNGAGPATCMITVSPGKGEGHPDADDIATIPVIVDGQPTPAPTATPTPCPALRGC